ncbi:MAG: hypothetical protein IPK07_31535 [Deltaproteobacteria bacterium]|nr:hypothetical protein [Deltaproteobacteria bacterium]
MNTGWTRQQDGKPRTPHTLAADGSSRRCGRAALAALILLAGCATPIGVRRVEPRDVYRTLTASALTNEEPSAGTSQVLLRLDLATAWEERPEAVLAELHAGLGGLEDADRLFALAELSFLLADANGDPARFLASAVYAYAFLFPADPSAAPRPTDPRLRLALDLYNRGLASGLVDRHGGSALDLSARTSRCCSANSGSPWIRMDSRGPDGRSRSSCRWRTTRSAVCAIATASPGSALL